MSMTEIGHNEQLIIPCEFFVNDTHVLRLSIFNVPFKLSWYNNGMDWLPIWMSLIHKRWFFGDCDKIGVFYALINLMTSFN